MINKMKQAFQYAQVLKTAKSALLLGVSISSIMGMTFTATAQQKNDGANGIEILVNDEPISTLDIDDRLYFVIASSGGVKTQAEYEKLREQVIQNMVDEILQIQETKEYKVSISERELEDYFARRAQQLRMTPAQFEAALKQIKSSKRTILKQMEASIAWDQLVSGLLGSSVSVSDEEVQATIDRIKANKGKFEYRLGEIVLIVDDAAQEASVKQTAEQIVQSLRTAKDIKFSDIARNISSSSTAAVGGDLGWIIESDLSPNLKKEIQALNIGEYTPAIRTAGSYRIYSLANRRKILSVEALDEQFSMKQIFLSKKDMADPVKKKKFTDLHDSLKAKKTSCSQVSTYAKQSDNTNQTELGTLPLRQLQGTLLAAVKDLKVGDMSDIVSLQDGDRIFFLCSRTMPTVQEPDFDSVLRQMEDQRLSTRARRHLRDLRREAIIDER